MQLLFSLFPPTPGYLSQAGWRNGQVLISVYIHFPEENGIGN